jgi:hypothetical protein
VLRVKAGSAAPFTDSNGQIWAADQGFEGGATIDRDPELVVEGTKIIFPKVVNVSGTARKVNVKIAGSGAIDPTGDLVTLSSSSLNDTNSLTESR